MVAGPSTGSEMAGELNFSAPLGHFITASATASADAPSRTIHGRPIHVEHLGQGAKPGRRVNTPARVPMDRDLLALVRLLDHA